jgi:CheY-like chemotaxis protein
MTAEEIAILFESEYTRFNVEANRDIEGTGLGMSIARQLISMMDGKISVRSTVGAGSSFTITIPQKVNGTAVLTKEVAENLQSMKSLSAKKTTNMAAEPMPYGRVLAVDDIESNLYVIEGYLTPYRLQVETVSGGKEAIEKVQAGAVYDIIFMDHMMPEMDGIEATKILRDSGYTHPIVALTANTIKGAKELFMENGFTGFIAKPIDILQLNAQLMQHIRDKQSPEVLEAARSLSKAPQAVAHSDSVLSEKIAQSFLRDADKALGIMQGFLAMNINHPTPQDLRPFAIQAHGMKSALANIQKYILSETAKTLESAANDSDIQTIFSQAPEFIKAVQTLIKEMSILPEQDENATDSDPNLLREQLKVIADACDTYNKKAANVALKRLRQEKWSQETKTLISELEAKLLHSEFEEVAEIIEGIG